MSGLGAAALREAVLAAWRANPDRLREDANAEEDHARGWYRDRVVVELAQNAADAAGRAHAPGRLLLRLSTTPGGALLTAANTGAPLDRAGVASLASLRASAKRDDAATVGRFGVGFAAVRSVADEVSAVSADVAVRFTLADARGTLVPAVDGSPALAAEVARRGDWLPVLRLPFEGAAAGHPARPPAGFATAVTLTLRDAEAVARVRAQLEAVDDALLLALPALAEVVVEVDGARRALGDVAARWVVARRAGVHDAALLADRPVEEAARRDWQVTWAVRRDRPTPPTAVHAPTPTDEPCSVPALLVATFPLDPTRRRVAPGPVTDALVGHVGDTWADLLAELRRGGAAPDPLDLVPAPLPAGELDAAVCAAVLAAAGRSALLPPAGGGHPLVPADAVVLTGPGADAPALVAALGRYVATLADVAPARRRAAVRLGAREVDLAELVDGLPVAATLPVLEAAGTDPPVLERLATVPVPLADGRVVRGARGLVVARDVPDGALPVLAGWGVRLVAPEAVHPALERLGARVAGPDALLREAAVRERVLASDDAAEVLLELAAAAPGDNPPDAWWGEVLLPTADGDVAPARELVLPGSDAERWFAGDLGTVEAGLARRRGDALVRLGVRAGLVVVRAVPGEDPAAHLDGWADYLELLGDVAGVHPAALDLDAVAAVADLDAVRPDAWEEVLGALAASPTARPALVAPVALRVRGAATTAPSYTAWWLRERSPLALPPAFALPGADPVAARLLGPAPRALAGLDDEALRALGGVRDLADLDLDAWDAVLDGLGRGRVVEPQVALAVWRALRAEPGAVPGLVPAVTAAGLVLVEVDDVAVADPMWAQHPGVAPCVVVPAREVAALAQALDVDDAPARAPGRVTSTGTVAPVPEAVRHLWPAAPSSYVEHDDLTVDGVPVDWWVADGEPHAATPRGVAHALARLLGWGERHDLARVLAQEPAGRLLLERAGDA